MAKKTKIFTYEGKQADINWDARLCIHIGECGRATGDLFVERRKPWCQPDLASVEDVVDVVERCPTGALAYQRKDSGPQEVAAEDNVVVVSSDGPLYLKGNLSIDGAGEDMPGVRFRAALCRCGQSKRKPFCDNSHQKTDFRDAGAVGDKGAGRETKGGVLAVKGAPNGPLLVSGSFAIVTGTGRVAWQGTNAALCRCGGSKNKPFCDGSHKEIGFEAD